MKHRLTEFATGLIFGLGLILSGMTDPGKVLGFLDLTGLWDPSLAFVMGGAILVGLFAFALAKRRTTTFFGGALTLPKSTDIDRRLIVGSLVFGAGWGVAGFCPGPAIVSAGAGHPKAVVFVLAMLAGMWIYGRLDHGRASPSGQAAGRGSVAVKPVTPTFAVAAQLQPSDLADIARQGFKTVINNRPDGEGGANQPSSDALEQSARAAGLRYVYLPVKAGAITVEQAQAMRDVLSTEPEPVLAFCRTGARSGHLHALAQEPI